MQVFILEVKSSLRQIRNRNKFNDIVWLFIIGVLSTLLSVFFVMKELKVNPSIIATFLMAISFLFGYISWDKRLAMRVLKDKRNIVINIFPMKSSTMIAYKLCKCGLEGIIMFFSLLLIITMILLILGYGIVFSVFVFVISGILFMIGQNTKAIIFFLIKNSSFTYFRTFIKAVLLSVVSTWMYSFDIYARHKFL